MTRTTSRLAGLQRRQNQARQAKANTPHPVTTEIQRARIAHDVAALLRGASLHAWTGQHAANTTNLAGRIVYIVAHACGLAGIHEGADVNILRGAASALGDLQAHPEQLELHRGAIQSGLAACTRLLPSLTELQLAHGAQTLDDLLQRTEGMSTGDVERALQLRAEGQPA
ncbi:hypothetical protein [Acidovorax sp. A1169]|uniref:hypothetical protein n=1 Tax=Acidovorax sp. A1169 TaxID=3059524 RepID=UPI0027378E4F|nr:hypothetical protein [Acidovorax sp. A1169]MDP4074232.1 hypothetical protein [Acidovorax sp. A1169]